MAFTGAEKARLRRYLGYSQNFQDLNPRLEDQMLTLGADVDAAADLRAIDAKLIAIDAKLQSFALQGLEFASLNRGEVVYADTRKSLDALQDVGRSLIQQIAITFRLEAKRDYYGASESGGEIRLG